MQTKIGAQRQKQAMIEKYGGEEGYREHFKRAGKLGGLNGTGHSFAHGKISPSEAGKLGGKVGRRSKK